MNLSDLTKELKESKNAALVVGAGISYGKVPLGYGIPMKYGESHFGLLKKHGLDSIWQQATEAIADTEKSRLQAEYVDRLVPAFKLDPELQRTFVDWLSAFPNMAEPKTAFLNDDEDPGIHAAIVIAWLKRVFNHLVTTNWDFLLEFFVDQLYYDAYGDPFNPVDFVFKNGNTVSIESDQLFFMEPLSENEFFWAPRWNLIRQKSDLDGLQRWIRPIWKIHGSPFFLACLKCGGLSHWKRIEPLTVGDSCPEHPDQKLTPEIVFWGEGIDTADKEVWKRLKGRLERSDMIVACGFSGSGTDKYLREVMERHPNTWVVNPNIGDWKPDAVAYVPATAAEFANSLLEDILIEI